MEHARKLDLTRQVQDKQTIVLVEEQSVTPKKRSFKKFIMRVSLFCVFAFPLFFLLQAHYQSQQLDYSSKIKQLKQAKVDLKKTKGTVADSKRMIDQLNDDQYIIELARKNLFFSKKGEIVFPNIK
ncbi:FtsB family cell division protein [Gottfriedia luciferensis]|uniref:FtsB family cell division protein n=1 Tax=Gottfriedia luciferensis TaxID=178774 RepID=UPI000B43130A|nr:septum formation initiator family protein [Gottfriedia luciferensis]